MDKHGLVDTTIQKRYIWIWEDAVAHLPTERRAILYRERVARRIHRWDEAVSCWRLHEKTIAFWWSAPAMALRNDIAVTTREPGFAQAVAEYMERENLPIRYVFAIEPHVLGRKLVHMPDVVRVFYGSHTQQFVYGPKGYAWTLSEPSSARPSTTET
jgi:hypothetical protein